MIRQAGLLMLLLVACDPGTPGEFGELSIQYRADDVIVTGREGTVRLGDVLAGARVSTEVVLTNLGLDPVRVTSIEGVSGATSQFQPELVLPVVLLPGAELAVPVVFEAGLIEEEVRATFRFSTHNPNGAATVHFEARTVKVACELPETVDFGVRSRGEVSNAFFELKNPSDQPLTVSLSQLVPGAGSEGQFEAPPGSPLGQALEIPARGSKGVEIQYRAAAVGSHTATLTVSHPACGERRVEFVGEAVDSTLTFAAAGDCGAVPVGQQVTREISFTNLGNKDVALTDITFTSRPNEFKVVADAGQDPRMLVVPAKGTGTLRIACQPASPGLKLDTLTFKTNYPRQAYGSINVKVFGG